MQSKKGNFKFNSFTIADIQKRFTLRDGEERIGSAVTKEHAKKYIINWR
jgi:hypothetical protein